MYKIAHISDLHVSYTDLNENGKKLVEVLTDIRKRNCDHVVVTGDIADNPQSQDLSYVREIFSHFDLLESSRMSVIPGNHDIFGGAVSGIMFFSFPLMCKEVDYEKNLNLFVNTFKETFEENNSFPYLKVMNNVALIGLNSIERWSEENNTEGSNGRVEKEEFAKLKNILSDEKLLGKYKVILIHHHFKKPVLSAEYPAHTLWLKIVNWKMKLYNKRKLLRLFKKNNINLILHGHTHINDIYNLKNVTIVNSSACVMPLTDDQVRKYNIISFPGEDNTDRNINIETILV